MTPRERAIEIVSRIAEERGLTLDLLFDRSRQPACDRARIAAYRALVRDLGWSQGQVARLFDRRRQTIAEALAKPERPFDIEELYDDLQRQLARYSGAEIAHVLVARLEIQPWQAALLGILVEAHPRPLSVSVMCELYDEGMRRLGRDLQRRDRDDTLAATNVKTFAYRTNRKLAAQGLPQGVRAVEPFGYALTESFAVWLGYNLGRPLLPSAVLARLAA